MPLIPLGNEPVGFKVFVPDECNLGDNKAYCALFQTGDTLYSQFKQTPCGADIVCDSDFSDLTGVIVNPYFNTDLSGWTQSGAGVWTWSAGRATISGGTNTQLIQSVTVPTGAPRIISFTVLDYVQGSISVILDGNTYPASVSADGRYSVTTSNIVTGTSDLIFQQTGFFIGSIDDIDIDIPYTSSCWTAGDNWSLTPNGAVHSQGDTDTLTLSVVLTANTTYQQNIIVISGMHQGTLSVTDGTDTYPDITTNGTYYFYTNNLTDYDLTFTPSSDFDGIVKSTSVYELRYDFELYISDLDGNVIQNITSASYYKDRVSIEFDTSLLDEGCYLFNAVDPCAIISGSELITDPDFNSPGTWSINGAGAVSGGKFSAPYSGIPNSINSAAAQTASIPTFTGTKVVTIEIETGQIDNPSDAVAQIWDSGYNVVLFQFNIPLSNNDYTFSFIIDSNFTPIKEYFDNSYTGVSIALVNGTATVGQVMEVKRFSLKLNQLSSESPVSNCFSLYDSQECAKLVQGYQNSTSAKLGFEFENGNNFRLSARYRVLSFNPFYPVDADDYSYSSGMKNLNYAAREKYWEVLFDYMDESALDAVTAMMLCDVFTINGTRYFVRPEDFKPEWNKDGRQRLAQLRVVMREIQSTIYNNKI